VRIDLAGLEALVAEQFLDDSDVAGCLGDAGGKVMAK
jgi:hypothetical protein